MLMIFFKTDKFWNIIFTLSFIAAIIILGDYLHKNHYDLSMFKFHEFVIVTLAAYRMTRLLVYDKVLDFLFKKCYTFNKFEDRAN